MIEFSDRYSYIRQLQKWIQVKKLISSFLDLPDSEFDGSWSKVKPIWILFMEKFWHTGLMDWIESFYVWQERQKFFADLHSCADLLCKSRTPDCKSTTFSEPLY
jgi:hypothetical protein